jgi:hypothetical protein
MPSEASAQVDDFLRDDVPHWDVIAFDLLCPRCDYNLRTLTRARCPECGLEFDWRTMIERRLAHSELLFEHAWRNRPVRSWLATLWWTLRPRKFCERVSIHDRIRVRPLLAWMMTGIVASLVLLHGSCWLLAFIITRIIRLPLRTPAPALITMHYQLDRVATMPLRMDYRYLYLLAGIMLTTGGLIALLVSLQQTLHRFRIRRAQMLRVVTYAVVPVCFWTSLLLLLLCCLLPLHILRGPIPFLAFPTTDLTSFMASPSQIWMVYPRGSGMTMAQTCIFYGAQLLLFTVLVYYLGIALKRYLQLPHPWRLATIASFVAALFSYTMIAYFCLALTGNWP